MWYLLFLNPWLLTSCHMDLHKAEWCCEEGTLFLKSKLHGSVWLSHKEGFISH